MPIVQRTMQIDGRTVLWREAGAGWPVVLLHGFPLSSRMWDAQLARVPKDWRFIAPDFRGFGGSALARPDEPAGSITVEDYAHDIGALMDCLELDDAVIVGFSMGGYVAFAMHRQLQARFSGLVLADTRPQADTPETRDARRRLRQAVVERGPAAVADQMIPTLLSDRCRSEQPDVVSEVRRMIESGSAAGIDAAIGAMLARPDSTSDLAAVSCATLVVVGEHDVITPPAVADAMQHAIARSAMVVVPGAGHLSNLEQPDVFSKVLADFLVAHL